MEQASLVSHLSYLTLFPLSIIEGPFVTMAGGFLSSQKILNPFIVYVLVVIGDLAGDTLWYCVGYYNSQNTFERIRTWMRISPEEIEKVQNQYRTNTRRLIVGSKLVHGIGVTGLAAAGSFRVPFITFITTCAYITGVQTCVFLGIGYLFGNAYTHIAAYIDVYARATIGVAIIFTICVFYYRMYAHKQHI